MKPLENKVALVTGAARGIGQAIALQLAADGADLALGDVQVEWLADTAAKVKAMGRRAETYAMNVADGAAVGEAVSKVHADFGHIDVLVNNAGITRDTLLIRMSEEDWDAVLDINLKGAFLVTKAVAKIMMKQRTGSIVNIASVVGVMGNPGQVNYSASKAGDIGFTRALAQEGARGGITVNVIAPGYIGTEMVRAIDEKVLKERIIPQIPVGRLGEPEEIARCVAFLAADDAGFITGSTISANGGQFFV